MKSSLRTLNIYKRVMKYEELSTKNLAEYYEVSSKTIERTFKVINQFISPDEIKYNRFTRYWKL